MSALEFKAQQAPFKVAAGMQPSALQTTLLAIMPPSSEPFRYYI